MKLLNKKRDKSGRKIWLSRALYTSGGALVCAAIILPITLTQCSAKIKKDIPVTNKFYKFENDGSILGWSDEVIKDPRILWKYNNMNLHGKTIDGECSFTTSDPLTDTTQTIGVFSKWACYGIDLSDTKWLAYEDKENNSYFTGYKTFARAELGYCRSLNLNGAVFATTNMTSSGDVSPAYYTFNDATFKSLETLNLSGAVFATTGMTTGNIQTGSRIFDDTDFSSLETLNFGNCEIKGSGTSDNTIQISSFDDIVENPAWSTTKLQLKSDGNDAYWNGQSDQLNDWFR